MPLSGIYLSLPKRKLLIWLRKNEPKYLRESSDGLMSLLKGEIDMFDWLGKNPTPIDVHTQRDEILNAGLRLAMDWGDQWLRPIQQRLSEIYTHLSDESLNQCNTECQATMKFGNELIMQIAKLNDGDIDRVVWRERIRTRATWINEDNLSSLYSQGMYYAYKDGGLPCAI